MHAGNESSILSDSTKNIMTFKKALENTVAFLDTLDPGFKEERRLIKHHLGVLKRQHANPIEYHNAISMPFEQGGYKLDNLGTESE